MAPPPKYLITRKLVRRYFDKYLPRKPVVGSDKGDQLFDCWNKNGIDHPKCKEFEVAYDNVQKENQNYKKKIDNLKIKESVLKTLNKPQFYQDFKGRFTGDKFNLKEHSIFDGLK